MSRYRVEHCNTAGVWVPVHRGTIKVYRDALLKKQAFCRILVDYLGNDVWEEIESFPRHSEAWETEKHSILTNSDKE